MSQLEAQELYAATEGCGFFAPVRGNSPWLKYWGTSKVLKLRYD
jgi:hypothetical protein